MPNNYVLLETIALTQSAASVTFDNLPTSGYTDLKIVMSARDSSASTRVIPRLTFNGSTTGYSSRALYGVNGSTTGSDIGGSTYIDWSYITGDTATASTFSNTEVYIPNYRSSNNKSVSIDFSAETNSASSGILGIAAGLWSNSAAITSITFTATANFLANSTFSLYGIAALGTTPVLAPKAYGGNRIENDGTYWIHTFTSSGNFIPQTGLSCDVLVVAGGGGGGFDESGGGGGGGYLEGALTMLNQNYTVQVGAGGAGGVVGSRPGVNGTDSFLSSYIANGGGGGGGASGTSSERLGKAGGSAGGASPYNGPNNGGTKNQSSISPLTGYGFDGGLSTATGSGGSGGGGGGAGAVGTNGSASAGNIGKGGNGRASSITGTSVTRAGGGGGTSGNTTTRTDGGTGGGGMSTSSNTVGTAGTANTGGGGGAGNGYNASSGGLAGGSGIVVIRYPIN